MSLTNEEETYNITFSKHGRDKASDDVNSEEVTNNRLEGAIFKLQQDNGITYEDIPGSFVASAFNGYFGFRALKPGRYRLMEVKPPEGYVPIKDPLLYFTVETITTNSGKIVHPLTGEEVDIKTIQVKFPGNDTVHKLSDLTMVDPADKTKTVAIRTVDSKDIDIENALIIDPIDKTKQVPLKDLSIPGPNDQDYRIGHTKVVEGKSGYISLEYDKANGVYQYVPEKSTTTKEGKLIDFVTSATAKNMGKIINEKPGEGNVTVKKFDQNHKELKASNILKGALFRLTNLTNGEAKTGTIGEQGTLGFKNLQIGNYRLEEIESPTGYENTGQVWNFTVGGKDLDPYAGDIKPTGTNLSDKIKLETTEFKINNPQTKTSTPVDKNQTATLKPHVGESMEFTNKYSLDGDIKINPGDYFVLEMTDNMDLNGIFENEVGNLDILAPGVGTIAKANYDRENREITYTFTEYAKTYNLVNFSNRLTGFIDLYKVKNSGEQTVGFGIDKNGQDDTSQQRNVNVKYELDYAKGAKYNNTYRHWDQLNMVSKIVHYDQETGDFVQYFYINRLNQYASQYTEFLYRPEQNVENLNISIKDVTGQPSNTAMPESFGIDNPNSGFSTTLSLGNLEGGKDKEFTLGKSFPGEEDLGYGKYIIKVTGRVSGKDKSRYYADSRLVKYYNDNGTLGVERYDEIYAFKNESVGDAKLEIQAVNPENKITFSKVDQNGKSLAGAKFRLRSKVQGTTTWSEGTEQPTDDNGILIFTKLKPGEYELIETQAPEGHKMAKNPVVKFNVDKNGRITREVTSQDGNTKTIEDVTRATVYVVNKKEQEVEFKKVDADNKKVLKGAEFEVWYKVDKTKDYSKQGIKLYEKKDGNGAVVDRLVLKEGSDVPTGYTEVQQFTTGKDGLVKFKVYEPGYYAIKETKAPKGYIAPRDFVKEFALINDKIQSEQYKTTMDVSKTKGYFYANGLHDVYHTDITMNINPDHEKITYEKDKSKITLSGLPLHNEYYENNIDTKQGITINARLVNSSGKSNAKSYTVPLDKYGTDSKGNITIDLYDLVKELEKKTGDSFESENTIELSMSSTLALSTTLDINSKIEIGDGEDKISEDRTFNIGTKGDEKVDHSYKFTTLGEPTQPIPVENRKATYPLTGAMGIIGFLVVGAVMMATAYYKYRRKRRESALS